MITKMIMLLLVLLLLLITTNEGNNCNNYNNNDVLRLKVAIYYSPYFLFGEKNAT